MRRREHQPQRVRLLDRLPALAAILFAAACSGQPGAPPPPAAGRADKIAVAAPAASTASASPGAAAMPAPASHPDAPLCAPNWKPARLALPALARVGGPLPERPEIGKGWTWITLWAAWCKPCKEELPRLEDWTKKLGMQLVPVSVDDDQRQLAAYLRSGGPLSASYWMPESDARTRFLSGLGLPDPPTLPQQLLVDPRGVVRCEVNGAVQESDFAKAQAVVVGGASAAR